MEKSIAFVWFFTIAGLRRYCCFLLYLLAINNSFITTATASGEKATSPFFAIGSAFKNLRAKESDASAAFGDDNGRRRGDSTVSYFDESDFKAKAEGNHLEVYVQFIAELGLPSLKQIAFDDPGAEAYRFMLMPAFSSTIIVQVIKRQDGAAVFDAYEVGKDGSSLNRTVPFRIKDGHLRLDVKDGKFRKFARLLEEGGFWELYNFGWGVGLDTKTWVIEGSRGGEHHFFSSSDPVPAKIRQAIFYAHEGIFDIPIKR